MIMIVFEHLINLFAPQSRSVLIFKVHRFYFLFLVNNLRNFFVNNFLIQKLLAKRFFNPLLSKSYYYLVISSVSSVDRLNRHGTRGKNLYRNLGLILPE